MAPRLATLTVALFMKLVLAAQLDSVALTTVSIPDGVYLTYNDFRRNQAVTKDQIISELQKDQLEFVTKTMFEEKFSFKRHDSVITMNTKSTWGFVQNNTFYVIYRDDYYRVPVFGSISYLVANVTIVNAVFSDPRFGSPVASGSTREVREFLINFYDGIVTEFNMHHFEELLSRDKELFAEFEKLPRRKQKDNLYRYIRKYNEKHPVYFLK